MMKKNNTKLNSNLSFAFSMMQKRHYDCFILPIANENLQEYVDIDDNMVVQLTGFTGDTGTLVIAYKKAYLLVDGRFTEQAKKEISDNRIEVVYIHKDWTLFDVLGKIMKPKGKVVVNYKLYSIDFVLRLKEFIKCINVSLINDDKFVWEILENKNNGDVQKVLNILKNVPMEVIKNYIKKYENNEFIFKLDAKYSNVRVAEKVETIFKLLYNKSRHNVVNDEKSKKYNINDICYITSDNAEIAYITNLRKGTKNKKGSSVLFDAFMIVKKSKSIIYLKNEINKGIKAYLNKNKVEIKKYEEFYNDVKNIKNKQNILLDRAINNYYLFDNCKLKKENLVVSPLKKMMAIRNDLEINNIKKINIIDGVVITKVLFALKKYYIENDNSAIKKLCEEIANINEDFEREKWYSLTQTSSLLLTEYDIKEIVDGMRKKIGKEYFICPSFETIVAYKKNSPICHYVPKKENCDVVRKNGILLIDSGGHYTIGTTDITRTISLYDKKIPDKIKKHYTMVINSLFNLSSQKFKYGYTGRDLDILARMYMYKEELNYNHGTGHGIGYVTSVHEGPNVFSSNVKDIESNVLEKGMLQSCEPGIYIENQYGIRLENDTLVVYDGKNKYGDFLKFDTVTLCPFDVDLIDYKYLDKRLIPYINEYNKNVYNKLYKYLTIDERKWLKLQTKEIKGDKNVN